MVERDGASEGVAVTTETHILDARGVSGPRQPHFFPAGQRGVEALAAPLLPLTAPLAAAATQGDEPLLLSIILSTPRRPITRNAPRMEPWP